MTLNGIVFALVIFALRVINNSITTINVIATVRQQRVLAAVLTFFESLIWAVVIANVINDLNNLLNLIAYSAGFSAGNYVGMVIQGRFMTNYVNATLIALDKGHEIALALRERGYGVTETAGEGPEGEVCILHSVMMREDLPDLLKISYGINPSAFVSIEPVRAVERGWIGRRHAKAEEDV